MRRRTIVRAIGGAVTTVVGVGCQLLAGVGGPDLPLVVDSGSCSDGKKDGEETGKDCGGACSPCPVGEGCKTGADCQSKSCSNGGTCLAPACHDLVKNGDETDVDCGGKTCGGCGPGLGCAVDADCKSAMCMAGACVSTCTDGLLGGAETDVDCGGGMVSGCPACADGKACKLNADCGSGICNAQACVGYFEWDHGFIAGTVMDTINVFGLALDAIGNAAVVGNFTGTTSFGGAPLTSAGGTDMFVATFDAAGNPLTSHRFGDGADQDVAAVAWDAKSNVSSKSIAITGSFKGSVNFTGTPLVSAGQGDAYVALLDPSGVPFWAARFGDAGSQWGADVAFAPNGELIVVGNFEGTINLGGAPLISAGADDIFLARFGSSGMHLWSKRFGGSGSDDALKLAVDANGNIILGGYTDGPLDFGNGVLPGNGSQDVFVAKLDSSGNALWSKRFGDIDDQVLQGLAVDPAGNVVVSGDVGLGSIDFGGGPLSNLGGSTSFLAKLGSLQGQHMWSNAFVIKDTFLGADSAGSVIVSATGFAGLDLGGGPLVGNGDAEVVIAKFDSTGKYLWGHLFGDNQGQVGGPVVAYDATSILTAGLFTAAIHFGPTPLVSSNGGRSGYLAKLRTP